MQEVGNWARAIVSTGHDDERHVRFVLPYSPDRLEAVHPRHEDVDDQQVELMALEDLETLFAVIGRDRLMALPFKQQQNDGADRPIVVDDKNARHAGPIGAVTLSLSRTQPSVRASYDFYQQVLLIDVDNSALPPYPAGPCLKDQALPAPREIPARYRSVVLDTLSYRSNSNFSNYLS